MPFFHDLIHQKSLKSVNFLQRVIGKIKGGRFWNTVYNPPPLEKRVQSSVTQPCMLCALWPGLTAEND